MKKIIYLFGLTSLFLSSCSSDSSSSAMAEDDVLVKKTIKNDAYGNSVTTNYLYDGNKMLTSSNSNGEYENYTYTGDLLTEVKHYENLDGNPNYLWETETFTYNSDNKLIRYLQVDWTHNFSDRREYVYNSDGTIWATHYFGDTLSQPMLGRIEKVYYSEEDVSTIELYTGGILESTTTFIHDTKNNPFKNVTGFNLIELNFPDFSFAFSHNLLTEDYDDGSVPAPSYEYTTAYTYNSNNFPITSVHSEVDVPDSDVTTHYIYY